MRAHTHTDLRKLDSPRELIRPSGGVRLRLTSLLADVFSFCAEARGELTAESERSSSNTFSSSASASVWYDLWIMRESDVFSNVMLKIHVEEVYTLQ